MKTNTLRAKLLNCFFAFTLVFGLCIPSIGSYAYAEPTAEPPADNVAAHVEGTTSQGENQSNGVGTGNGVDNGIGDTGGTNILGDGVQGETNTNNADGTNANDNNGTDAEVATTQADEIVPMADVAQGAFTVSGGAQGTDYSYASGVLTIKSSTPLTIKNTNSATATADRIVVAAGVQADITLAGINISTTTGPGILVTNATNTRAHITLADGSQNIIMITSGNFAGVECEGNAVLVIDDSVRNTTETNGNVKDRNNEVTPVDGRVGAAVTLSNGTSIPAGASLSMLNSANPGELDVVGGPKAAGIGSKAGTAAPGITAGLMVFNGGIIYVSAWGGAATTPTAAELKSKEFKDQNTAADSNANSAGTGIGGGDYGGASTLIFNNAEVYAHGSYHGAGIGSGFHSSGTQAGNIFINGGYIKAQGYAHGNAFGKGCGGNNTGKIIKVTGGTLLPYCKTDDTSRYHLGGSGGNVIITGGSVHATKFEPNAYNTNVDSYTPNLSANDQVFMLTIDLKDSDNLGDAANNGPVKIDNFKLTITGSDKSYGAPSYLDDGKLYIWLPTSVTQGDKEVRVDMTVQKYNSATSSYVSTPLDTLYIQKPSSSGNDKMKRFLFFDFPVDFQSQLTKQYDGTPFEPWVLSKENKITYINPVDKTTQVLDKSGYSETLKKELVQFSYQALDENDKPTGPLSQEGATSLPSDSGSFQVTMTSYQYAENPTFANSYYGHRATGKATITPAPAVLTMEAAPEWGYQSESGDWTPITEENANAGVAGNRLKLRFNIRSANTTALTCKSPTGSFQISIDGQKVGDPIPLTAEAMAASNGSSISWDDLEVDAEHGGKESRHATEVTYYFNPTNNDALLKALEDASKGGEHTINIEYIADKNYIQGVDKNPENAKEDDTFIVPVPPTGSIASPDDEIVIVDPDPIPDPGGDDPVDPESKTRIIQRTITVPYSKFHQASQPNLDDYFNLEIQSSSSAPFTYDSTNPAVAGFVKDGDGNVTLTDGAVGIQVNSCGTSVLTLEQKPNALYTGTKYILTIKVVPDKTLVPFVQIRTVTNNLTHPGMPAAPGDEIEYLVTGLNTTPGSSWQAAHLLDAIDPRLVLKEDSVKLASNYSTPNNTEDANPNYKLGTEAFYEGFDWSTLNYNDLAKDQYDFDKDANKITKGIGSVYGGQSTTLRFVATLQSGTAGRPQNPDDPKDIQNEPNGDGGYGKEDSDLVLGEDPTDTTPLPKKNIVVVGEPDGQDKPVDPANPGDNPGGDKPNPIPPLPVIPKDPVLPGTDPVDPDNPNPPVNPDDPDNPDKVDPDIYVNKTAKNLTHPDGGKALKGDIIEYTITVGNKGKDTCYYWPIIKDALPVGLEPVAGSFKLTHVDGSEETIADTIYNKQTRTVALYVDDLYYNEEATLAFQCTVTPEATDIKNTAQVYGTTPSDKWKGEHPDPDPTPEPGKDDTLSYIKFDANGGKGAPEGIEGAPSSEITDTFPTITPTRKGYTFIGWNTAKDGKGTKMTAYPATFDKDHGTTYYYAQWKESYPETPDPADGDPDPADPTTQAHIAFAANGGTGAPEGISGAPGSKIEAAFPTEIPVAPGYKFLGWNTQKDGNGKTITDYPESFKPDSPSTTIYYAQWEKIPEGEPGHDSDVPKDIDKTKGDPDPVEKHAQSYVRFSANGGYFNKNIMTQAAEDEVITKKWSTDGLEGKPKAEIKQEQKDTFPSKEYNPKPVYRPGYEFLGWFTKRVGGDEVTQYGDFLPGEDARTDFYYAHWKKDPNYVAPDDDPAPKPGDPVNPNGEGKYPWEEPGTPEIDTPEPVDVGKVMPADPGKDDLRITLSAKNETRMDGYTYVGDEATYTILIENLSSPEKSWLDVIARADIPEGLKFIPGSIYLTAANGEVIHVNDDVYNDVTRILALNAGDLAGGQTAKVVFKAEVTVEALNKDIGMTSYAYATLPSKFDVNDESYVKPELGSAFVPTEGWEAFAETHVNVFNPEKVYPSEKVSEKTPPLGTPEQQAEAAKLAKTGDTTALVALGIGTLAIAAGVALVVARRRMKKNGR